MILIPCDPVGRGLETLWDFIIENWLSFVSLLPPQTAGIMQAPANSGSTFYNYKSNFYFSIVLLAVVDTEYRFIAVDIG